MERNPPPASPPLPAGSPARWGGRMVIALLLAVLLGLGFLVLQDFLVPLLWAAILAYVTWPLHVRICRWLHGRRKTAALLMTFLLAILIILPLLLIVVSLREEAVMLMETVQETLEGGAGTLPPWLGELPWIGPWVASTAERLSENPESLAEQLSTLSPGWVGEAAGAIGALGRNALKFGFALIAAFFFYRDGDRFVHELRRGLTFLLGPSSNTYWTVAAGMTQAVVYGLVLTALAQGIIAGFGYWVAGLEAPVLFGALTALFALVPFGAPLVWGSVTIWLLWQGQLWAGLGLLAWGALAVSSVDNVVRPLVISFSARISFLLVLFGVLGGLNAFGLVGLFLGPIILAVLWAVWKQWLEQNAVAASQQQPPPAEEI